MTKAVTGLCMGCMGTLSGQGICPRCGFDPSQSQDSRYIRPGTALDSRYTVGRAVHKNGEGAQYIGYDSRSRTPVWIQEYFPVSIAQRGEETGNILPLPGYGAQYKALMSDFVDICNDVRRLSITEPVVPIDDMVYENNTVYAIYRDMDLTPLQTWLERSGGRLGCEEALDVFLPLLNTLSNIHGYGAIHRGISPYTVYVNSNGNLYLWDFALSATRTAGSELDAELFSGYSAPEQYSPNGWQGAWTDVYAAAALFYRLVSGVVPPRSTLVGPGRAVSPLSQLVADVPPNVSDAIADAMKPQTEQRTQAVATLTSRLLQGGGEATAVYDTNRMQKAKRMQPAKKTKEKTPREKKARTSGGSGKYVALASVLTVVVLGGLIAVFMGLYYPELLGDSTRERSSSQDDYGLMPEDLADDAPVSADVPRFIGLKLTDVRADADYRELFVFRVQEEYDDIFAEGEIFAQEPEAGEAVPQNGVVTLFVSKGTEKVEMPELEGLSLDEALEALSELGLTNVDVFRQYSASVNPNSVISSNPAAGEEIDTSRKVFLFVTPDESVVAGPRPDPEPDAGNDNGAEPERPGFFWYAD